jgi:hypothetical protein
MGLSPQDSALDYWYFTKSTNKTFDYNTSTTASAFKHNICVTQPAGSTPNSFTIPGSQIVSLVMVG